MDDKAQKIESVLASLFAVSFVAACILLYLFLRLRRRYKRIEQSLNGLPRHQLDFVSQSAGGNLGAIMTEKSKHRQATAGELMDTSTNGQDVAFALITPTADPRSINPFDDAAAAVAAGIADFRRGGMKDLGGMSSTSLLSLPSSNGRSARTGASGISTEYYHRNKASTIPPKASSSFNKLFETVTGGSSSGHKPSSVNTVETVIVPITRVSSRDSIIPTESEGSGGVYTDDEYSDTRSSSNLSYANGSRLSQDEEMAETTTGEVNAGFGVFGQNRARSQTGSSANSSMYDASVREAPRRTPHNWAKSMTRR